MLKGSEQMFMTFLLPYLSFCSDIAENILCPYLVFAPSSSERAITGIVVSFSIFSS